MCSTCESEAKNKSWLTSLFLASLISFSLSRSFSFSASCYEAVRAESKWFTQGEREKYEKSFEVINCRLPLVPSCSLVELETLDCSSKVTAWHPAWQTLTSLHWLDTFIKQIRSRLFNRKVCFCWGFFGSMGKKLKILQVNLHRLIPFNPQTFNLCAVVSFWVSLSLDVLKG